MDIIKRLTKIDSIVTICLTITFCVGCFLVMCCGAVLPEALTKLYEIVVIFYFGTKTGKAIQKVESDNNIESDE